MSTNLTLQAALVMPTEKPLSFRFSIPSGTVLTFLDADSLDAVAEQLAAISPAILGANISQVDRTITASGLSGITDGHSVLVTHDAHGASKYHDFNVSASPSASPSSSGSASPSASPSASASRSPSASPSRSPSASPSAS